MTAYCLTCRHRFVREESPGIMAGIQVNYCREIGTSSNARTGKSFEAMRCEKANAEFCNNVLWKPTLTYRLRQWLGLTP